MRTCKMVANNSSKEQSKIKNWIGKKMPWNPSSWKAEKIESTEIYLYAAASKRVVRKKMYLIDRAFYCQITDERGKHTWHQIYQHTYP